MTFLSASAGNLAGHCDFSVIVILMYVLFSFSARCDPRIQ